MEDAIIWLFEEIGAALITVFPSVFYVVATLPLLILRLLGTLTPTCDQSTITAFPVEMVEGIQQIVGLFWPLRSIVNWLAALQVLAAVILYKVVRVVIRWVPVAWNMVVGVFQALVDFFWPF